MQNILRRSLFTSALLCAAVSSAYSQQLSVFGGAMKATDFDNGSYAWALDYTHVLGPYFAASISWLNEGHVPDHHRDGIDAQLWARVPVLHPAFSLAGGIGPYYFFDTRRAPDAPEGFDEHGWGVIYSLAMTWHEQSRWLFQLRVNKVDTRKSLDTTSFLFGVGYRFNADEEFRPEPVVTIQSLTAGHNEVTVFAGKSVVNTFSSEDAFATSIEYRRQLARHVDWTVAWLNEGDTRIIRRNGVASQFWAVHRDPDSRLTLGIGAGAYIAINQSGAAGDVAGGRERLAGLLTMSVGYALGNSWLARFSWNRVIADYSHDSDVFLLGAGYAF